MVGRKKVKKEGRIDGWKDLKKEGKSGVEGSQEGRL